MAGEPGAPALVVQDDAELLYGSRKRVARALDLLDRAGVRTVRLTAGWSVLAPGTRAGRPPPRFRPTDPASYVAAGWARLDRAVRGARARGMAVNVDIAFWAPVWGTAGDTSERPRKDVDPLRLAQFAKAVARRYTGDYDPPGEAARLPAVRAFTIWNEPNLPEFLGPQWRDSRTRRLPASPHHYRRMVAAAYPAIKAVQPRSTVLVGGLAAYGRGGVPPLRFLRELACVDTQLRPLARRECARFERVPGDGFAHHPYSTNTVPDRAERAATRDDAPLARLGELSKLLRALAAAGRVDPGLRDLYLTEYGYETDPPDPGAPFGPRRAARMWSWAEAIAAREPAVRTVAQFLVRDLPGGAGAQRVGRLSDWQSGFLFLDGRPKPLADALAMPLHAERGAGEAVRLWGRVRPGSGRRPVRIALVEPGGRRRIAFEGETDEQGVVERTLPAGPGSRFRIARRSGGRWMYGPPVAAIAAEAGRG